MGNYNIDQNLVILEVQFPKIKTNSLFFKEFISVSSSVDIQNALGYSFTIAQINIDPISEFIKYNITFEINIPALFENTKKIINLINKKQSTIFWTDLTKFFVVFSGNRLSSLKSVQIPLFEELIVGKLYKSFDNKIIVSKEKIDEIIAKYNELKNKN